MFAFYKCLANKNDMNLFYAKEIFLADCLGLNNHLQNQFKFVKGKQVSV